MSSTGYTRQSASQIASGQPVASAPVNNEFNQLQSAFDATSGHVHNGASGQGGPLGAGSFSGLNSASTGVVSANGANSFVVTTLTGTTNQITVVNGTGVSAGSAANPTFSISNTYAGQTSITTLGTIATGVWQGTLVNPTYGGTGVNNGASTLTLSASLATSGANAITLTTTGITNVTLPTSGTLVNSAVSTLSSLSSIGTIATGVWQGTVVGANFGGTGVANGSSTITLGGSLTFSGAHTTAFTVSNNTAVTLPTSGTLLSSVNNLSDVSSATTAANNLLPTQTGNSGKFLTTNGLGTLTWASVSGASGGTVTSVTFTGDGTVLSSTPSSAVTLSGTVTAALANAAGGTVLGNNTSSSAAPSYSNSPVVGINTSATGKLGFANGNASGATVTVENADCTSAYNFRLPATAGSSGQFLTSAAGTAAMTWTPQSSITSLGTIATGTWNGTLIGSTFGGTGINNGSSTITIGGNVAFSGAHTFTGTVTANTAVTFPTSGTLSVGAVLNVQAFSAGGTYTPTSGMRYCWVRAVAGGGGSGGVGSSGTWSVGGAGGAGSYGEGIYTAAQIGASKTVTIGAAGTAGTSAGGNGGSGGATSLGVLLTTTGGTGGVGTNSATANGAPGAGGAAGSGGNINTVGATACYGFVINGTTSFSAPGADAPPFGVGGAPTSASGGTAGSGFGSGASGASSGASGTLAGAAGGGGAVLIVEYS